MSSFSPTRPWPVPTRPWIMRMEWHDLLFMHWPLPATLVRPLIPAALQLDTFDGWAWIGVVPFTMRGVRPRLAPTMPLLSAFCELNVRTYVTAEHKPGVWFFSLDAANPLAVRAARLAFRLPYYDARMDSTRIGDDVHYQSVRTHRLVGPAVLEVSYRPTGPAGAAPAGSLEHWLTARYCLYAADRHERAWRGDIDHAPWPLQAAEAEIRRNTMTTPLHLTLPGQPPLL
ncbi:MAG: YqjF family protein, partial [Chloroflexota bacterium]